MMIKENEPVTRAELKRLADEYARTAGEYAAAETALEKARLHREQKLAAFELAQEELYEAVGVEEG